MPTFAKPTAEYTVADQQRMRFARNYFDWQARLVLPHLGRRVIEIGCGLGNFTRYMLDRELVIGIDVEPACAEQWQNAFPGQNNLIGSTLDVTDPSFLTLKQHQPDTVVCLNVLEHVEDDITALKHMYAVLPKGGRALLIVPAYEGLYGPIDHNLGHYRRYSKKPFAQLAASIGFQSKMRYMNMVGCLGWWTNAKILKKTEQSEGQIKLFDAAIVPILSRIEAAVPPPFGQSIFAVLEK
ncbi:MAG: class I SAM-dependent methyltransferase [Acidobacteriota bacterium]